MSETGTVIPNTPNDSSKNDEETHDFTKTVTETEPTFHMYVLPRIGVLVEDYDGLDFGQADGASVMIGLVISYAESIEGRAFHEKVIAFRAADGDRFRFRSKWYRFLRFDQVLGIVSPNEQVDVGDIKALQQVRDITEQVGVHRAVPIDRPASPLRPDFAPIPNSDWSNWQR